MKLTYNNFGYLKRVDICCPKLAEMIHTLSISGKYSKNPFFVAVWRIEENAKMKLNKCPCCEEPIFIQFESIRSTDNNCCVQP